MYLVHTPLLSCFILLAPFDSVSITSAGAVAAFAVTVIVIASILAHWVLERPCARAMWWLMSRSGRRRESAPLAPAAAGDPSSHRT